MPKLKVFVSWSGKPSRQCALLLRDKLPHFNHLIEPFVSSADIPKGDRNIDRIAQELAGSQFGIVCVTPANLRAPWINFESGALSREVGKDKLAPFLLLGTTPNDLYGTPLQTFQATQADLKEDVLDMIRSINTQCETPAPEPHLADRFDKYWPELEAGLAKITLGARETEESKSPPQPSAEEMQDQILSLLRQQVDRIGDLERAVAALHREQPGDPRKGQVLFDGMFADLEPAGAGTPSLDEPEEAPVSTGGTHAPETSRDEG
ncbi:toll/interleukin-1 receptor domain-containing protein [Streptomyces sp. NBC_00035]|uniref:toll/interleukin-1 receptor domain-containing protein n=1 Tax=Streptomyces sp. NBC_00035 TaxID=2903614 RepID=UPI003249F7AA